MDWIDANRRCKRRKKRMSIPHDPSINPKKKPLMSETTYPFYYFLDCGSSGMDDSPRAPRSPGAGEFFDWIDLSSQMVLSFRCLAKMCATLGDDEKSKYWLARTEELAKAINDDLWCKRTKFYHDRSSAPNFVNSKTIAGFWPILAEIANDDKLDSLINYLQDEKTFNRLVPVPTLSADDCNYCEDGTYWIGGVWAPTNYMVTRGLTRAGAEAADTAHRIAVKYLDGLTTTYRNVEPHSLWECYNPEKPLPGLDAYFRRWVKPDFVGWSGLGPIAMLIENIFGIEINAPARRLDWNIRLCENHGIENLKVGDAIVSLKCEFSESNDGKPKITVNSNENIDVQVKFNGKIVEI
jgi:glycogen debranching enzyme